MIKAEIPFLTVAELSELIRKKEVSPVEATEAYLDRIDALDFKFNAYLTVCRKQALEAARQAEQAHTRHTDGGKGPIVEQGYTDHRWQTVQAIPATP